MKPDRVVLGVDSDEARDVMADAPDDVDEAYRREAAAARDFERLREIAEASPERRG